MTSKRELSAYLKSDVEVLAGSLAAFSEEMVELTGINPVTVCDDRQYRFQSVAENVPETKPDCPGATQWLEEKSSPPERRSNRVVGI